MIATGVAADAPHPYVSAAASTTYRALDDAHYLARTRCRPVGW
ncbi:MULTISPECIES: hypothetical protein [unclassified Streptomyces]|nr:hypothetical protein [Streptomyces sp. A1136]